MSHSRKSSKLVRKPNFSKGILTGSLPNNVGMGIGGGGFIFRHSPLNTNPNFPGKINRNLY